MSDGATLGAVTLTALADDQEVDDDAITAPVAEKQNSWIAEIAAFLLLFLLRSRWSVLIELGWSRADDGSLVSPAGHLGRPEGIGPEPRDGVIHGPGGMVQQSVKFPPEAIPTGGVLPGLTQDASRVLLHRLAETKATEAASLLVGVSPSELETMVKAAMQQATTLVQQVDATTVKQLAEGVAKAKEAGQPVTETEAKKIVDKVFNEAKGPRTNTAAVTETAATRAQGVRLGIQRAGLTSAQWVTERDDRVRPNHRALEGQVRNVGRMFDSPDGDRGLGPGGFSNVANNANCRCVLIPHTTSVSAP